MTRDFLIRGGGEGGSKESQRRLKGGSTENFKKLRFLSYIKQILLGNSFAKKFFLISNFKFQILP